MTDCNKTLTITLLSFLLLSLMACGTSKADLQGDWMCAYYANMRNDSIVYTSNCNQIIGISGNKIDLKLFNGVYGDPQDPILSCTYDYEDGVIRFEDDLIQVISVCSDSMVLKTNSEDDDIIVYKPLPKIESPKFELDNGLYELNFPTYKDTFQVMDSVTLINLSSNSWKEGSYEAYRISKYKNYQFLLFEGGYEEPYLIHEKTNEGYELKFYYTKILEGKVNRLVSPPQIYTPNGEWISTSPYSKSSLFTQFLPRQKFANRDTLLKITINEESIAFHQFGLVGKYSYWKSITGRHFFMDGPDSLVNRIATQHDREGFLSEESLVRTYGPFFTIESISDSTLELRDVNHYQTNRVTFKRTSW